MACLKITFSNIEITRQNIHILAILLYKWNKISVTYFEYRYTLEMFLQILEKSACFDSCVRLAGGPVYLFRELDTNVA